VEEAQTSATRHRQGRHHHRQLQQGWIEAYQQALQSATVQA